MQACAKKAHGALLNKNVTIYCNKSQRTTEKLNCVWYKVIAIMHMNCLSRMQSMKDNINIQINNIN